ncbi:multiple epidermal growth factor-like domains protein 10 isoform X2 [Physella acuta]|uniref:multiple epidermal growth factor-like domains protein 10 isoform X2 n=1 Tax=Physella acuta TaxID=109671 RepID=UPI0027DD3DD3|nr:multiple epidermal growth factor-like domains protein 10 isoform X2 [Physella acuta]
MYQISTLARPASYVKISAGGQKILTLCEVFIFGDSNCGGLKYGPECSKSCNCLDEDEVCFVATGGCASGCAAGFYGEDCQKECEQGWPGVNCSKLCDVCEENDCATCQNICYQRCIDNINQTNCTQDCDDACEIGKWGENCNKSCDNCLNNLCDSVNGSCLYGCLGFDDPPACINECEDGKWGENCTKNCSNCKDNLCDKVNGSCTDACIGYDNPPECNQNCNTGSWGVNCSSTCTNCMNSSCSSIDGSCELGCLGYSDPPLCRAACKTGKWGENCINRCSNCKDNLCDNVNGSCTDACLGYDNPPACNQKCQSGSWGVNCSSTCTNCMNSSCSSIDGICELGCIGYSDPPLCRADCDIGKWGENCNKTCNNCLNSSCDRVNGSCLKGCLGFDNPPDCNKGCEEGDWGENCSKSCTNCKDNLCDKVNGSCSLGCLGYVNPPECSQACDHGKWGENCTNKCNNCVNNSCDSVNGHCVKGCLGYYNYPVCNKDCKIGKWGVNCSSTCTNCMNSSCSSINGSCELGCIGYSDPPQCTVACERGKWGENCNKTCNNCLNSSCDRVNGSCLNGCLGFDNPPDCNKECNESHYGLNCEERCSNYCTNQICEPIDGYCITCIEGNQGVYCNESCDKSFYGQNCSLNCSSNCTGKQCHPITGHCATCIPGREGQFCNQSCEHGYFGKGCSEGCSTHCAGDGGCDSVTGDCLHNCTVGFLQPKCTSSCIGNTWGYDCKENCSIYCNGMNGTNSCNHTTGECLDGCLPDREDPHCLTLRSDNGSLTSGIVIFILCFFTAIAVTSGGFIFLRNRRKRKKETTESLALVDTAHNKTKQGKARNKRKQKRKQHYVNVNLHLENISIPIKDLNSFILSHDSSFYLEQFTKIPDPMGATMEAAHHEDNKLKNRYKNVSPYDHSRVYLETDTNQNDGDYINASYIADHKNNRRFIASQGPTLSTLHDFLRMLLEQRVEIVVMLTNLIEEQKTKCDRYWPEDETMIVNDIHVKLISIEVFTDYTIRSLKLARKGKPSHHLKHFHYTSWPDRGVPSTPWALIDFLYKVDVNSTEKPIVVHCSAGVGRTGTFIALHNLTEQAKETGSVDFFKTLVKLRQDRMMMVQMPQQYEFLHKAAHVAIACSGTTVKADDLSTFVQMLADITELAKEFHTLTKVVQDLNKLEGTEGEENIYENNEIQIKSRFPSIAAKPCHRAVLTDEPTETIEYINAVLIPCYTTRSSNILTQLPLPATVADFWKLITHYEVQLIVSFELDQVSQDESIGKFLPSDGEDSLVVSMFKIMTGQVKKGACWEEQNITLLKSCSTSAELEEQTVKLLSTKCTDMKPKDWLAFIRRIKKHKSQTDGTIVYMCRNGAKYSGLACVLGLLIDRIEKDQSLTVPIIVGAIKSIRPEVISTFDQYRLLYQVLALHCNTTCLNEGDTSGSLENLDKIMCNDSIYANAETNNVS